MAELKNRTWNKLFGIGMPKTGTNSLATACKQLGLKAIHFPEMQQIKHVDMVNDLPVTAHYKKLDLLFPNSKFILTIRDQEAWETSFEDHLQIQKIRRGNQEVTKFYPIYLHRIKLYGTHILSMPVVVDARRKHEREVFEYFANRLNDLLIMNIPAGDGWNMLCPFIDLPIPDLPFPHQYKTEDIKRRLSIL